MRNIVALCCIAGTALCLLVSAGGCGGKVSDTVQEAIVEKAVETGAAQSGQKVDVDVEGDSLTMTFQEGDAQLTIGAQAEIPENFPKDVPVYPGATVSFSQVITENQLFSIQAVTNDPLETVFEYYKEKSADEGWTEGMAMSQGMGKPMRMLNYTKEGRVLNLMLIAEEDQTVVHITTGNE